MSEAFTANREHPIVYYAKAIYHGVDRCYIEVAYNYLPYVQGFRLSLDQIEDITLALEEMDLITGVL
jgi:hypothetical protein